jgi:hypothetical protein
MNIPPVEFQQRGAFSFDRHLHAPMPVESVAVNRMRCPSCNLPVVAPVASTYLHAALVEDDWHCSRCGFEWRSGFDGLRS